MANIYINFSLPKYIYILTSQNVRIWKVGSHFINIKLVKGFTQIKRRVPKR